MLAGPWTPGLLDSGSRPTRGSPEPESNTNEKFAFVRLCVASACSGSFLRQATALKLSAHLAKGYEMERVPMM